MKKIITTISIVLLGTTGVFAQRKTFIKVNPTTLVNEADVYLSQELSPSITLEAGGGFIYTDYWDYLLNKFDFGQIKPNLSPGQYLDAKGYAARLGLRFYVISPYTKQYSGNARGTYFEPLIVFKQIWYPDDNKKLNSNNYVERGEKYVSGLQLLIGRQYRHHKIYIDKYLGLGVRAKTYSFDNYQLAPGGDVNNNGKRTTSWLPSIQMGIKIAFGLSHR